VRVGQYLCATLQHCLSHKSHFIISCSGDFEMHVDGIEEWVVEKWIQIIGAAEREAHYS